MPKFIIISPGGNITRTVNLPYEGVLVDISDMQDIEWEELQKKLHTLKVEIDDEGRHKKDHRGLPKLIEKP